MSKRYSHLVNKGPMDKKSRIKAQIQRKLFSPVATQPMARLPFTLQQPGPSCSAMVIPYLPCSPPSEAPAHSWAVQESGDKGKGKNQEVLHMVEKVNASLALAGSRQGESSTFLYPMLEIQGPPPYLCICFCQVIGNLNH